MVAVVRVETVVCVAVVVCVVLVVPVVCGGCRICSSFMRNMKWSCLAGALTICLLSYLLAVQLSNSRLNLANNKNLEALVIAKYTN